MEVEPHYLYTYANAGGRDAHALPADCLALVALPPFAFALTGVCRQTRYPSKMKYASLAPLLVLLLAGCGSQPAQVTSSGWTRFNDSNLGLTFDYPSRWG
ncbi:MAG TPA: hypothetical protein VGU71_12255, partial [Candidatus Dormibacteraeota bacterium]|nr:hypothetical protein [Candidatus Dormibacteraeota bacterium]